VAGKTCETTDDSTKNSDELMYMFNKHSYKVKIELSKKTKI
jgi:hypothetical protein